MTSYNEDYYVVYCLWPQAIHLNVRHNHDVRIVLTFSHSKTLYPKRLTLKSNIHATAEFQSQSHSISILFIQSHSSKVKTRSNESYRSNHQQRVPVSLSDQWESISGRAVDHRGMSHCKVTSIEIMNKTLSTSSGLPIIAKGESPLENN